MKNLIYFIILIFACSFKTDNLCLDQLLLNINYELSNKKQFKVLSENVDFKMKTTKTTFKKLKYFKCTYSSKNNIFKNCDSIKLRFDNMICENVDGKDYLVKAKAISISIFFPDSISLYANYNYIVNEYCKNINFDDEVPLFNHDNTVIIGTAKGTSFNENRHGSLSISVTARKSIVGAPVMDINYSVRK